MADADRPEITLDSGIVVYLDCLFQYRTYSGLLEGLPTRRHNAERIERARRYAAEKLWMGGTPLLLAPREVPMGIPRERWFMRADENEPVEIPPVASLATFESMTSARDPQADCSSLKVVWFQDEFGPPAGADVLRQFRAIDWRALATDGYW
jgi:hypothetical protein